MVVGSDRPIELIDLPGVYQLHLDAPEARIVRELIGGHSPADFGLQTKGAPDGSYAPKPAATSQHASQIHFFPGVYRFAAAASAKSPPGRGESRPTGLPR